MRVRRIGVSGDGGIFGGGKLQGHIAAVGAHGLTLGGCAAEVAFRGALFLVALKDSF